jgi:ADP-ribose pyrophosphatase
MEVLADGRHLRLVKRRGWEFVERKRISGIVVIVALTADRRMLLVEQYRPPVDCRVIELPAGLAGDSPEAEGELLEDAARRELLEETGYRAETMVPLFHGPPSAGITSEQLTFFGAPDVQHVDAGGGDETEEITVHAVALDQLPAWLEQQSRDGKAIDVKVYAGLYAAVSHFP